LKVGWKKLDNPIFTKIFGRRTLEMRLKQSRLAAMMFKILYRQKKVIICSSNISGGYRALLVK
jgi:hypothetical protein